jgi:hypothetical protein
MKSIIIILAIAYINAMATAQTQCDSLSTLAGYEMVKFSKQTSTANLLYLTAGGIITLGALNGNVAIIVAGGVMTLVAIIIDRTAHRHARKAGKYLIECNQ